MEIQTLQQIPLLAAGRVKGRARGARVHARSTPIFVRQPRSSGFRKHDFFFMSGDCYDV